MACTPAPARDTDTDTGLPVAPMTSTFEPIGSSGDTEAPAPQAYECGDLPDDPILKISIAGWGVCARRGCALQCWGRDEYRQLGHARSEGFCMTCQPEGCCLGDDEHPVEWGDIDIGAPIIDISTSGMHTCVVLQGGAVRCWGDNSRGQLGLGHRVGTPLRSPPSARPDVKLGASAVAVTTGRHHTCALLVGGAVRCWGLGSGGLLGRGDTDSLGDDELPSARGDLDLGGPAVAIAGGDEHTCAILNDGSLRCWGHNTAGQLGHGHIHIIGDDETPASAGPVPTGASAEQIAVAGRRTCIVTTTGGVRCWGAPPIGHPGFTYQCECEDDPACCLGDDETPDTRGDLDLGGPAAQISLGPTATCAVLTTGTPLCWGFYNNNNNNSGLLGPIDEDCAACDDAPHCCIGDDEPPSAGLPLQLGAAVQTIAVGSQHACAVAGGGEIRCWGANSDGLLGLGNTPPVCDGCQAQTCCLGDNESIAAVAPVRAFSP